MSGHPSSESQTRALATTLWTFPIAVIPRMVPNKMDPFTLQMRSTLPPSFSTSHSSHLPHQTHPPLLIFTPSVRSFQSGKKRQRSPASPRHPFGSFTTTTTTPTTLTKRSICPLSLSAARASLPPPLTLVPSLTTLSSSSVVPTTIPPTIPTLLATSSDTTSIEFDEDWEEYNPNKGTFVHHMVAGSFAGFVEHAGMYPVDWIKTHMQANRHASSQDMSRFVQKQSLRTMYRGVTAVFAGVVPAHSAYFSIYEVAKERFGANKRGHHPMAAAASGAVATISHDLVMTPLDVVKQRMQLGVYSGVLQAMKSMIKHEGISSLYLSLPTTILMNIPAASVNVAVNESCRRFLNPSGDFDMRTFFISGTIAGGIAGAVTNPLDVIKTRLQTQTLGCDGCGAIFQGGVETTSAAGAGSAASSSGGSSAAASSKPKPITKLDVNLMHTSRVVETSEKKRIISRELSLTCARKYNGFMGTAKLIYAEEGLRGFSRGTLSRALTQAPAAAFSWSAYEGGKAFLNANYL